MASALTARDADADREPRPARRRWPVLVVLCVVLALGFGVRMVRIREAPLSFHPTRQFHSALITRKYVAELGGYDETQRVLAERAAPKEIELPLMEATTAVVWRVSGHDSLWVPRVLSSVIWLAGGVFLFLLIKRLTASVIGALVGAGVWALQPYAVQATRTFQPDPLMMTATIGAVLALVVDDDQRTRRSFWIAALATGFAALVKAPALFFVLPVLLVLAWRRDGFRGLFQRRNIGLAVAAVAPTVVYLGVGSAIGFLEGQEGGRFLPKLLTESWYWQGWARIVSHSFGWLLVAVALLGIGVVAGRARAVGLGLVAGYVVFGLIFTYHYTTHDYYHLPLISALALGVGFLVSWVDRFVTDHGPSLASVAIGTVVAVAVLAGMATSGTPWIPPADESGASYSEEFIPQAIGEAVHHSTKVIFDAPSWGNTLQYYGDLAGDRYPTVVDIAYDDIQGKTRRNTAEIVADLSDRLGGAEYFVVTDIADYDVNPGLSWWLADYPIVARGDGWLVFDLRHPIRG